MTTVLALVQEFCDAGGLPTPAALIGATDKSTKQYRALMLQTIRDLSAFRWQQQRIRQSFTTVAAELQGKLTDLFGLGYNGLVKDTMWNDTRHMRIFGPIPDQIYNALQTLPNAGPEFLCYFSRDSLYVTPQAVANETISAIVITKYNVLDVDGVTYKEFVTNDSDTVVFPDDAMVSWFTYKWRKQKGEPGWENDYNDAMSTVAKNLVNEGGETLSLSQYPNMGPRPGIIIPPGSWPVSP